MESFTPIASTVGGVLIGLASIMVLRIQGRVAGISGICGSLLRPSRGDVGWRVGFTLGLIASGAAALLLSPAHVSTAGAPTLALTAVAGVLVGFGTRLGNGCTSGHGVCGISRLSRRSIVATATFMAVAGVMVFVTRHLLGGGA
ncbi:MAG: YeeE/YedE family protein [Myxococcales bacterium]|nr:YeeE/YedE family protein [Myxococcales bacterium]